MFGIIAEGKTKKIWPCVDDVNLVEIENKDDITAGDGERHDIIKDKGSFSTQTTVQCFKLLERGGTKTHYSGCNLAEQNNVFVARRCRMIPLEVVTRRFAEGSYLKRYPQTKKGERFETPLVEFFLKDDTNHDPFLVYKGCDMWYMYPASEKFCEMGYLVDRSRIVFGSDFSNGYALGKEAVGLMVQIARLAFLILEKAWKDQQHTLIDLKIEFGFDCETGELLVADVIDNDSWRLHRDKDGEEMSKQSYRDGEPLEKVHDKYFEVAVLSLSFID